jgi:hypothetical protein
MTHQANYKQPESDYAGVEIIVGDYIYDGITYGEHDLWLAREHAQNLAAEEPGEIVWLFDGGSLSSTYLYDPEDGLDIDRNPQRIGTGD